MAVQVFRHHERTILLAPVCFLRESELKVWYCCTRGEGLPSFFVHHRRGHVIMFPQLNDFLIDFERDLFELIRELFPPFVFGGSDLFSPAGGVLAVVSAMLSD